MPKNIHCTVYIEPMNTTSILLVMEKLDFSSLIKFTIAYPWLTSLLSYTRKFEIKKILNNNTAAAAAAVDDEDAAAAYTDINYEINVVLRKNPISFVFNSQLAQITLANCTVDFIDLAQLIYNIGDGLRTLQIMDSVQYKYTAYPSNYTDPRLQTLEMLQIKFDQNISYIISKAINLKYLEISNLRPRFAYSINNRLFIHSQFYEKLDISYKDWKEMFRVCCYLIPDSITNIVAAAATTTTVDTRRNITKQPARKLHQKKYRKKTGRTHPLPNVRMEIYQQDSEKELVVERAIEEPKIIPMIFGYRGADGSGGDDHDTFSKMYSNAFQWKSVVDRTYKLQ